MRSDLEKRLADSIRLSEYRKTIGVPALERLVEVAEGDSHQSRHIRRFLLALYNGAQWPIDLTRLRVLDPDLQIDILAVLQLDWVGDEVHGYIRDGDDIWKHWWERESHPSDGF